MIANRCVDSPRPDGCGPFCVNKTLGVVLGRVARRVPGHDVSRPSLVRRRRLLYARRRLENKFTVRWINVMSIAF